MASNLGKVQNVDIDPNGVFKYIQIEVKDSDGGAKRIVRGYGWAEYHGACDKCLPLISTACWPCRTQWQFAVYLQAC